MALADTAGGAIRRRPHVNDASDIEQFKQFLRIRTLHPHPDFEGCLKFLKSQADFLGLSFTVHSMVPGFPLVVMSRQGNDPSLSSVVLNCHMDVVPVVADKWTALPPGETPFSAWEDPSNGRIYARGSQDMKCVGSGYLAALRRLRDVPLARTIHTVWVPDEEVGGNNGMKLFVQSQAFKDLRAGIALDEGLAHEEDHYVVYYGERTAMWVSFTAVGKVGHAAKLIDSTAVDRLSTVIERFTAWRRKSAETLHQDPSLEVGDVTSVNITHMHAGTTSDGGKTYAFNVIPSEGRVVVDTRVKYEDFDSMLKLIDDLAAELNLNVDWTNDQRPEVPSQLSATTSGWCRTLTTTLREKMPLTKVKLAVFPAATDSRYIRGVGIPAFGFSPMRLTPSLLHDHNEYLQRDIFLEGVDVYETVIKAMASVTLEQESSVAAAAAGGAVAAKL